MSQRPNHLDLSGTGTESPNVRSPGSRFNIDLPSPRVGEIPPALSPLDAFAQQSRLLAKRFEESQQQGRRISRLDHREVANEFSKRPVFFKAGSSAPQSAQFESTEDENAEDDDELQPPMPQFAVQSHTPVKERPISHYPMLGMAGDGRRQYPLRDSSSRRDQNHPSHQPPDGYFNIPRADSPEPYEHRNEPASPAVPSLSGSVDSLHSSQQRTNTDDSQRAGRSYPPPASPAPPSTKKSLVSIKSVMDLPDEELRPPRKFSESSHGPRARSPFTPDPHHLESRSPSIRSDRSTFQDEFRRPSFNFSRPLSSGGNTEFAQYRQSCGPQQSFESRHSSDIPRDRSPLSQDSGRPSLSQIMAEDHQNHGMPDNSSQSGDESAMDAANAGGAPSYIYAKYSLPRGRTVERVSPDEEASWEQHQFRWESSRGNDSSSQGAPSAAASPNIIERPFRAVIQMQNASARSHSADGRAPQTPRETYHRSTPSSPSVYSHSTDRTIRAHAKNSPSQDIVNMTPEAHLEKGIECHSSGALSKSTYHLRLAARAGHPTGMLLYALACRHGWGMRANQNEGVQWLKKAVDSSSLEMLEITEGKAPVGASVQQSKTQKIQFALAIYELGMSYMNGWGTPKDRALAVRCFEVAGNWGDCDALAEAAFCYTQGLGCKKDLKKAAGLYRRAAEGGMSMAGNSW